MHRVDVNGMTVAYERVGDGAPLVLLHGFTHDSRVWRPQLEGLTDRFTVIAWDAPGAGRSPDPPEGFGMGDWAAVLAGLLESTGDGPAHIVGLSWGGLLAQEFWRRHPARVRSLVLADTYAGWAGSLPAPLAAERLAACVHDATLAPIDFVPRYLPSMFSASVSRQAREELAGIMSDFHPNGFVRMSTVIAHADTRDLLPTITAPTLLIWGEADVRSPMAVAHQFEDLIPGSRLVAFPGVGHVSNLEAPDRFTAEVRSFCEALHLGGA